LVGMECNPDCGSERERHERRRDNAYRPEQRPGDAGDQATAAERARHTPPEPDIREQVERWAAAEGDAGIASSLSSTCARVARCDPTTTASVSAATRRSRRSRSCI